MADNIDWIDLTPTISREDVLADIDVMMWSLRLEKLRRYRRQRFWEAENRDAEYADRIEAFPRLETVAEHTWHVTDMILILAPHFPELSIPRSLELGILHDKMEILIGDENPLGRDGTGSSTHAFNEVKRMTKADAERLAVTTYVSTLRESLRPRQECALVELLDSKSPEARFVKSVDKLQALIYVILKKKGDLQDAHLAFTVRYSYKAVTYFPPLTQHHTALVDRLLSDVCAFRRISRRSLVDDLWGGQLGFFE